MAAQNQNSKFVLQVYDGTRYRPCYIAPHATDKYYGDTKIVDTVNTPSKEGVAGDTTAASTSIVPSPKAVSDAIATALKNELLPAARAKHLTADGKDVTFGHKDGGTFTATWTNPLSTDHEKVTFTGVLPLSAIPQGAQERLVICDSIATVISKVKATPQEIQQGDVVQIPVKTTSYDSNHKTMYYMYQEYDKNKHGSLKDETLFNELFKEFTAGHAATADNSTHAQSAARLDQNSAGGTALPVYFSNGVPVSCSDTVGNIAKPVYMKGGTITACSDTVGNSTTPAYMKGGTITACTPYSDASVKHATSADTATKLSTSAGSTSAGSATQPVYFLNGIPLACKYTINESVPTGAKFTDTTYTALKNPYTLKISLTGGSTTSVTYDGSSEKTISIPIPIKVTN